MSNALTTPAPDAIPARAGHLGIGVPRLPSNVGAYHSLFCECCRALYAAATPGKWAADHDWTDSPEVVEYVHLDTGTPGHTALFDTSNGDHRLIEVEHDENGATYRDSTGRANMELVAAMHEALPGLLTEVEEASSLPNAGPRIANMRAAMASASERIAKLLDASRNGRGGSMAPAVEDVLASIQAGLELALEDDAK